MRLFWVAAEDFFQSGEIELVDGEEAAVEEGGPILENAGDGGGLLARDDMDKAGGDAVFLAGRFQALDPLGNIGALVAVVNGQLLLRDPPLPGGGGESGEGAVEAFGEEAIAVIRFVGCFEAEGFGEALIRKPVFLLTGAEHTDARSPLLAGGF